jgi:dienelactone hydrolase
MTSASLSAPLGKLPIYFGLADRPLFGWFHPPAASLQRPMGVVLCNPIGEDMVRAHRPFRHLAETLAAAGFPVLRFDFDGTGDSSGDERDPERVATWRGDIMRAANELRARSGVSSLALVGLKLGGTLAALAAGDLGGVDALVLWGAFDGGSAFVAESTRAHKMHTMLEPASFSGGPPASDGQEALGFLISTPAIAELAKVELLATSRSPAQRTLVLDIANVSLANNALTSHLRALGSATTYRHMPGQRFLITPPNNAEVPRAAIDAIAGWLVENAPPADQPARPAAVGPNDAHAPALRERAVVFGTRNPLFGVLTSPPAELQRGHEVPAIIVLNSGTAHRIGAHRLTVPMARRWAAVGFHVLRMDLSGIGDSPTVTGNPENQSYPKDALQDVQAAMDYLAQMTGRKRFVIAGLCSGGDIAFQVAYQDARVAGAVLMNPRTFGVNDLGVIASYQSARWYQGSLMRASSWVKLLRGDVDVARAVRIVAPKVKDVVVQRAKRAVSGLNELLGGKLGNAAGGTASPNDIIGCLRSMVERGVDTFMLVTEHDPGIDYIDTNFGADIRALGTMATFQRTDVKGTDSTFTARWAQEHVSAVITDHLKQRFLASASAPQAA